MARIPDNELDRLKREVALVRLVESTGIELKKHGKDYLGLCPFHEDHEPSLVISPDKNLWHCLGACGEGGDVIQWVMKRQGVRFRHAIELLRESDPALSAPSAPVKRNTTNKHPAPLAANSDDQKQLAVVIDYYHETLKQSPEALDYLKRRGLDHPELIERFRLGYANRTLGYRLPEKNRKAGAEVRGQLQQIGILRKSGHEHFSGSLVIPVFNPEGVITEVYGRKLLGAKLRKGTPQHLYLPGPHVGVFNEAALQASDEINMSFGDRHYRIRGLQKNLSFEVLKVNLLVRRNEAFHVDALELYNAKQRAAYIKAASIELGLKDDILKRDLGKVLLKCEALQEQQIKKTLAPEKQEVSLTESEQTAALELLKNPALMPRILADFERCGVVGEATNTLIGYLACVSRKLDKPLAVMIQSTSAAGKSTLMDAVLALMPEEERVQYSAMTGQSLFYMGETNLKHKILAIAEEEGAEHASYALKLLQSEGVITIASTGKDDTTGDLVTKEYRVEGPVMLFLTTTAIDIDEELMNRCLVLSVNESRDQTQAIHAMQRQQQTLEGLLAAEDKKEIIEVHRNAQRLIKPLRVTNPYANQLTFIDDKTRTRRDHLKYLALIRSIALLHQYQREHKCIARKGQRIEYIEATLDDIETANKLAHEVLGRTLDELPPQTRKLLKHIHAMVTAHCQAQGMEQKDHRFSRRDIRAFTGWSDGQLKIHCCRLTELEYLLVHRGGRGQRIDYELLYDGSDDQQPHLMGLIDPEKLRYDEQKIGQKHEKTAPSQGQVSPKIGPS